MGALGKKPAKIYSSWRTPNIAHWEAASFAREVNDKSWGEPKW
jgi:hypothetical protein